MSRRANPPESSDEAPPRGSGTSPLAALLVAALSALVFAGVAGHAFLAEGDPVVSANPLVQRGLTLDGLRMLLVGGGGEGDLPLARLSSMIVVALLGPGPGPQHLASACLHLANALLVLALVRRLGLGRWASMFVALAFAVHPLAVEPVSWIVQRGRLLATTFALATIRLQADPRRGPDPRLRPTALLTFVLALFAHPLAAAVPLVLLALDLGPRGGAAPRRRARLVALGPFFALGTTAFVLAWVAAPPSALPAGTRLAGAPLAIGLQALHLCAPFGLAYHYPHPSLDDGGSLPALSTAIACVALLVLTLAALRARNLPRLRAGWLWFVGASLVAVLLPYEDSLGGDRDAYLASTGFLLALAASAEVLLARRAALRPLAAGLALALVPGWALIAHRRVDDWRDSASLNARALAVTTDNEVALRNRAADLTWRGKLTEAGEELERALALRPRDAEALQRRAEIELRRARHGSAIARPDREARWLGEAEKTLLGALDAGPPRADVLIQLGEIGNRRGDDMSLRRAEERLQTAVELAPLSLDGLVRLGQVRLARIESDAARAAFRRAVHLAPSGAPEAWCGLGLAALQDGREQDAQELFLETIAIEPDHVEARTNLGRILIDEGRLDEAQDQLEHAIWVHPRFADALYYLARAHELQGHVDEAQEYYEATLEQEPAHIRANMALAWILAQRGRLGEAAEHANVVLMNTTNEERVAEASSLLARIAMQAGDWEGARAGFERAAERDPRRVDDRANLGLVLVRLGELDEARKVFRSLRADDPGNPRAEYGLALIQVEDGDLAAAKERLLALVRTSPELADAWLELARVCERQGGFAEAIEHYRAGLQRKPGAWALADGLARLLAAAPDEPLRDGDEALALARRCAAATERRVPGVLETLAAALAELRRFDEAVAVQQEALALVPESDAGPLRARLELYERGEPLRLAAEAAGGGG